MQQLASHHSGRAATAAAIGAFKPAEDCPWQEKTLAGSLNQVVAFAVGGVTLALPRDNVWRTVRAVAATPLPQPAGIVWGVVNVQGRIVPVISLRRRLGLVDREIGLADQLLIARSATHMLAMMVDTVAEIVECGEKDGLTVDTVVGAVGDLKGVVKRPDGLLLIHDLDSFLLLEEKWALGALTPVA